MVTIRTEAIRAENAEFAEFAEVALGELFSCGPDGQPKAE